jgi:hypothetical protein
MKQPEFLMVVFTALVALSGFPGFSSAQGPSDRVIYVKCTSGSEDEDGSLAHPYRTVTKGYLEAMDGDTIIIAACDYPEIITFKKRVTIQNECGTMTLGAVGDSGPKDFVLTASTVPVDTTGSLLNDWNDLTTNSLGVAGEDTIGKWVGPYPAQRKLYPLGIWFSLGTVKQTLCGRLQRFCFYEDDGDWNNDIIPTERYAYLLQEPKRLPDVDLRDWIACPHADDVENLVETEIAPHESFHGFSWFNANTGKSPLEGKCLCTYGPWVLDAGHGRKPEIHPSELLWWRNSVGCEAPSSASGGVYLLLVQDKSKRFDRTDDYDTMGLPNLCWHPWSAYPRTGRFKLAFRVNTLATPRLFNVQVLGNRNVNINLYDATAGSEHTLVYNGRPLLTVRELDNDGYVQVGFESYFRRIEAEGEVLYGFVTLTSSGGKGDRGDEGYILIYVTQ